MTVGLEGIKVIQTAVVLAGPMCARLLADWGADVIRVEHPKGYTARAQAARLRVSTAMQSDIDYPFENLNRNKRSMTLDLSKESGQEILYKLLEKADVLISNFRPREIAKFKLEYETLSQLNPRLIYACITGYGRKGPDQDQPGFGTPSFCARSGFQHLLEVPGMDPVLVPRSAGDNMTGLSLAYGIMTALFIRERTGVGQEVDASLFHAGVWALSGEISRAIGTGQELPQIARKDRVEVTTNFYPTKDGRWFRLGIMQPEMYWSRLCQAIEREDLEHDPRFESPKAKIENHAALFDILDETFRSKTLAEWKVRLTEATIPWAPVQTLSEVINDPQARANDFFVPLDHPKYGRMEVVANPISLSKSPQTIRMPAAELGQHTEEVLLEHGYTREDIARFKEEGAID